MVTYYRPAVTRARSRRRRPRWAVRPRCRSRVLVVPGDGTGHGGASQPADATTPQGPLPLRRCRKLSRYRPPDLANAGGGPGTGAARRCRLDQVAAVVLLILFLVE